MHKQKSLDFNDFKHLVCAETKIFGFQKNNDLAYANAEIFWILNVFKSWHVQKLKYIDFKDLACAKIFGFNVSMDFACAEV